VDEIQQALAVQENSKIQDIHTIVSKYLGDKQIAQLTQELQQITQKKDALHMQQVSDEIHDALQKLEEKRRVLETDPRSVLGDFLQTIEQKKQAIDASIAALDYENTREKQTRSIAQITETITSIKNFLQTIDWKQVEAQYTQWQSQQTQKEAIQRQLDAIDTLIQTQQARQKQLDTLQAQIQQREQDLQSLQAEYSQEQDKLTTYKDSTHIIAASTLQQWEAHTKTIEKSLHTISDLARDHTSNQQKLNALTQEEKILTNLYQIVSKELLLLVL
jgi:chromosome segregation ATPase